MNNDMTAPSMAPPKSPFNLEDSAAYAAWRARKLTAETEPAPIAIADIAALTDAERRALLQSCQQRNFALFRTHVGAHDTQAALQAFGRQMGLLDLDQNLCAEDSGVTAITVKPTDTDHVYIPYTSRPLGWHTDGYYNAGANQVRAWLLYCAEPAAEGGANELMDHEIAYIRVRDENPEWIRALMAPDAFTIPSNTEGGAADSPGPRRPGVLGVASRWLAAHALFGPPAQCDLERRPATRDAAAFLLDLFKRGDEHIYTVSTAEPAKACSATISCIGVTGFATMPDWRFEAPDLSRPLLPAPAGP